jgi:hypothetical protein
MPPVGGLKARNGGLIVLIGFSSFERGEDCSYRFREFGEIFIVDNLPVKIVPIDYGRHEHRSVFRVAIFRRVDDFYPDFFLCHGAPLKLFGSFHLCPNIGERCGIRGRAENSFKRFRHETAAAEGEDLAVDFFCLNGLICAIQPLRLVAVVRVGNRRKKAEKGDYKGLSHECLLCFSKRN